MVNYLWTVKTIKQVGKLPIGAWVEITVKNTGMKPMPIDIFRAFEKKYGVSVPHVAVDQYFSCTKG